MESFIEFSLNDLKILHRFFGIQPNKPLSVLIESISRFGTVNKGELTGVRELDFDILLRLSDADLASVCQTDKNVAEICKDDYFWKLKVKNKYGFVIDGNHKKLYQETNHKTPEELLIYGTKKGMIEIVKYAISHGAKNFNEGLREACQGGHIELVELMIQNDADDFNWGLYGACLGGHYDLAELMIKYGAKNFNWGLFGACEGGYINLAKLMIKHGADPKNCPKFFKIMTL